MTYFEMTIINGKDRKEFDITVNEALYYYLLCHTDSQSLADDWFVFTVDTVNEIIIKALCKTDEEKTMIAENIKKDTIVDILIHRTILVQK